MNSLRIRGLAPFRLGYTNQPLHNQSSPVHAMKTLIRVFALGMPLILGCWTARSATTNAVLTFHIVSEKKIGDGRFIDTPILPKVGYIRSSPDMVVTNLQGVYSQKDADYYTLVQTDGTPQK